MEGLPLEICLKIFCCLDYQSLATAQQVCRKWKVLALDDNLWSDLFKERWGGDRAEFYAPTGSKSWKDVYEVQDRCDRIGLGLKITREGGHYYLVHQGEIQRYLGSRRQRKESNGRSLSLKREVHGGEASRREEESHCGILDNILFFIGDLEVASSDAKRARVL